MWWHTGAEAAHILRSGDVLMTTAPAGRIVMADQADHRNFGIQWNAGLYEVESWAMAKGSPDLRQAEQFLYFAGMPAVEARLFERAGTGGLAKGANDGLAAGGPGALAHYAGQSECGGSASIRRFGAITGQSSSSGSTPGWRATERVAQAKSLGHRMMRGIASRRSRTGGAPEPCTMLFNPYQWLAP